MYHDQNQLQVKLQRFRWWSHVLSKYVPRIEQTTSSTDTSSTLPLLGYHPPLVQSTCLVHIIHYSCSYIYRSSQSVHDSQITASPSTILQNVHSASTWTSSTSISNTATFPTPSILLFLVSLSSCSILCSNNPIIDIHLDSPIPFGAILGCQFERQAKHEFRTIEWLRDICSNIDWGRWSRRWKWNPFGMLGKKLLTEICNYVWHSWNQRCADLWWGGHVDCSWYRYVGYPRSYVDCTMNESRILGFCYIAWKQILRRRWKCNWSLWWLLIWREMRCWANSHGYHDVRRQMALYILKMSCRYIFKAS